MEKEQKDSRLDKAYRRVQIADRIRLACLLIALLLVLFVFYGNKAAAEAAWYISCRATVYSILSVVVLLMFVATLLKLFFAAAYNRILKEEKKQ